MSANDYYNAGKPQEQGGYYPPQGTFIHFLNPYAASPIPAPNFAGVQYPVVWLLYIQDLVEFLLFHSCSSVALFTGPPQGPPQGQGGYYPQVSPE